MIIHVYFPLTFLNFYIESNGDSGSTWWVYFLTIFEFCLAFSIIGTVKFIMWRREKNSANQTDLIEEKYEN